MISYLSGEIIELEANKIILLTNGWVWYNIWISDIVFIDLSLNIEKDFYIYHHITEGNQSLFWFLEKTEKQIFEELIKISWIWGKVAIQILSLWINKLSVSVANADKKTIESIKWIWKKMAEKIILELKDKDFIKNYEFIWDNSKENKKTSNSNTSLHSDIISTLTNMWYSKQAIEKALSKIPENLKNMEEIIPAVIREM
jgi:Holliday junction DNA helicase RuvA